MKKPFACVLLFTVALGAAAAGGYRSVAYHYSISLPADWLLSDEEDPSQVILANKADNAAVIIGVFDSEPGMSNETLLGAFIDKMRLKGDTESFTFKGFEAAAGNFRFSANGARLVADILVFHTRTRFFMIMGSSLRDDWDDNTDTLTAIINSFSLDAIKLDAAYRRDGAESSSAVADRKKDSQAKADPDNQAAEDDANSYTLRIDWKDLAATFPFVKPDFYTAVREGQSIVASGNLWAHYRIDPESDPRYTETFWSRFFQDMYDKNYRRVTAMVAWFRETAREKGWTSYELAMQVIKCAQAIPYERPYQVITDETQAAAVLDYFTPNEIAWYNKGDCDTKSMLIVMILRQLGYDLVMYFSEPYQHAMAGININARGTYKTHNGKKYYFVEATYPGWNIGDLPPEFGDPAKWTVVPIN